MSADTSAPYIAYFSARSTGWLADQSPADLVRDFYEYLQREGIVAKDGISEDEQRAQEILDFSAGVKNESDR